MRMIVTVHFRCEICERDWPKKALALRCEASPPPALRAGDVVLWRGRREGGPLQTVVFDVVESVGQEISRDVPGHHPVYRLRHDHRVRERDIRSPRSGYINIEGRLGYAGLDTRRVEIALRDDPDARQISDDLVRWLIASGVPLHPRIARLYQPARRLEYEQTWARGIPSVAARGDHLVVFHLSTDQAESLRYLSRLPDRRECLAFLGGQTRRSASGYEPHEWLDGALDSNRYLTWGGVVDFDLTRAFDLLARTPDEELIQGVLAYRARLLTGEAAYVRQETLRSLFPLDESKARGKWPPAMLRLVERFDIHGSGPTRLRRLYERSIAQEEKCIMPENDADFLRLWTAQVVFAVMSGKGGVGKSTVTADLARALVAAGKRVLVVDLDLTGPSQPLLFPVEDPRLRTRNGKLVPHLVEGIEVISMGHLLSEDEPLMWRGPYLEQLIHLFGTSIEAGAEVILLDMPPGTGDVYQAVLHLCPHALFVIVSTAGEVAMADVRRAITALTGVQRSRIAGIVENMAYISTQSGRVQLWGKPTDVPDLASAFHARYLGALPMAERGERLEAIQASVLPGIMDCLAGKRYLEVALDAITQEADRFLTEHQAEQLLPLTWGLDNLAAHLEQWVANLGGDPRDERYHEHFRHELRRLWKAVGTCLLTSGQKPAAQWWAPVLSEMQASARKDRSKEA